MSPGAIRKESGAGMRRTHVPSGDFLPSDGDRPAVKPIARPTAADSSITNVMARWRPSFSASSLPRMLAGMASAVKSALTATAPSGAPPFAATKPQKATSQVRTP